MTAVLRELKLGLLTAADVCGSARRHTARVNDVEPRRGRLGGTSHMAPTPPDAMVVLQNLAYQNTLTTHHLDICLKTPYEPPKRRKSIH